MGFMSGEGTSGGGGGFMSGPQSGGGILARIAELERIQKESGARAIEQETPGFFRTAADILSRPNYAVAGAVEQILEGTPEEAFNRAFRELFSGIAGLHGEKRAFGEVLERAGVGPGFQIPTPFGFNITGRGAAGLALDIAADPITYLTFGIAGPARTVLVGGVRKALSREGLALVGKTIEEVAPGLGRGALDLATASREVRQAALTRMFGKGGAKRVLRLLDEGKTVEQIPILSQIDRVAGREVLGATRRAAERQATERVSAAIESGATHLLDPGGIKWMGIRIAGNPFTALRDSGVSKWAVEALGKTEGGAAALQAAKEFRRGLDTLGSVFSPGFLARNLPDFLRERKDVLNLLSMRKGRLMEELKASALAGLSEDSKVAVARALDGDLVRPLRGQEVEAFKTYRRYVEQFFDAEQAIGLIDPNRRIKQYFAHFYTNPRDEVEKVLNLYRQHAKLPQASLGRHAEERVFRYMRDAERWSAAQHAVPGSTVPVLKPLLDPLENLRRRGLRHIDATTWRPFLKRMEQKYGKVLPDAIDPDEIFDLIREAPALPGEMLRNIEKAAAADNKAYLPKLPDEGKRYFMSQRIARATSRDDMMGIVHRYQEYADFFPKQTKLLGKLADDGTPILPVTLGSDTYMLPKSLATEFAEMDRRIFEAPELKAALRGFDWLNNTFKTAVTVYWPAFHFRNLYSNVAQGFVDIGMGAINPKQHFEALAILIGDKPSLLRQLAPEAQAAIRDGVFTTKIGTSYTYAELRQMLDRAGVRVAGNDLMEYTGRFRPKLSKPGRAVGTAIENEGRTQLFLNYLRRGLSPDDAAERVNKFLFDYRDGLTRTEREIFRRAIPFYVWQSRNLKLMFENLVQRPGKLLAEIKPFRGRESENRQMAGWEAGALKLRLDGDGRTVRMISGVDLPIRNLDMIWRGSIKRTMQGLAGMTTPLLKAPFEVATGVNLFMGQPLERKQSDGIGRLIEVMNAPKPIRNWLGYRKDVDRAGRPRYTFDGERFYLLFQSWAFSRVVSTTDRQFREYLDPGNINAARILLDSVTGFRRKDLDLTVEQERKMNERMRQLERVLVQRGEMRTKTISYGARP